MDARFLAQQNEMNFRFDAVNQRFETFDQKFSQEIEAIDEKFTQKFESIDLKFDSVDQRFNSVDQKFNVVYDGNRICSCSQRTGNNPWRHREIFDPVKFQIIF
jgi:hypothetical protein